MFRSTRDETGATLVLTAFLILGLFALLAAAVDIARILVERNQMQLAADAGALAAAVTALSGDTLAARDSAVSYALANRADTTAMAEDSAVVYGVWDPVNAEFEAHASFVGTNAVRVRASRTSGHLIAWLLGSTEFQATATAIGSYGSAVTQSTCQKPFVVAQQTIDFNNDGVISREERDLAVGQTFDLVPAENPSDAPSFYYAFVLPPFYDASEGAYQEVPDSAKGAAALEQNLGTCNPDLLGVGDSILTKPGKNTGPMMNGLEQLCGFIDATGYCNPTGVFAPDGLPGMPVKAPLWDARVSPIGRTALGVTDLAAFRITQVLLDKGSVNVKGIFISMVDSGSAAPGVGLVQRPILVK